MKKKIKFVLQVIIFTILFLGVGLWWQATHVIVAGESTEITDEILNEYNVESLQELNELYPIKK